MITNELQEKIDSYLLGTMSAEEKTLFEKQLAEDIALVTEVNLQKDILAALRYNGDSALKDRLNRMHTETDAPGKIIRMNMQRILAVAAIFIVLITVSLLLLYPRGTSNNKLYASYFSPYDASLATRGDNNVQLSEIENLYTTHQYQPALDAINKYIQNDSASALVMLMKGICEMETDQPDMAEKSLQWIRNANDPFYSDQATWYLALLDLKKGNREAANTELQKLAGDEHADHHIQAVELLNKLQ